MATPIMLEIAELGGQELQTRVTLDEETINDYAEVYREDEFKMPPIDVIDVLATNTLLVTDGFHRIEAARRAGRTRIRCLLARGTPTDALKAALKANSSHGLRRTNADKRKALALAWERREELFGGEPSHEALAEACGVSKITVRRFRENTPTVLNEHGSERIGTNGKRYSDEKQCSTGATMTDHAGQEVPENLVPVFKSKTLLQAVNKLSKALREVNLLRDSGVCYEMAYVDQSHLIDLEYKIALLRRSRPYAVCPVCGGSGCMECRKLGFLPKDKFESLKREIEHAGGVQNLDISTISTISNTNTESSNNSSSTNGDDFQEDAV